MKVIIHDLTPEQFDRLSIAVSEDDVIVSNTCDTRYCTGCFGCWLKTPGQCVIPDRFQNMGKLFARADELLIVSRCSFGSYSSFAKNVLDRAISYVSPFFVIRKGEMHHKPRYQNTLTLSAVFYGEGITEAEQKTARLLVQANAVNLNGKVGSVRFMEVTP